MHTAPIVQGSARLPGMASADTVSRGQPLEGM